MFIPGAFRHLAARAGCLVSRAGRLAAAAAVLALALASASCSQRQGWALVLWPPEGSGIPHGSVVPIYFISNITKTYAVGVPGSREKAELELWRVEEYRTRAGAKSAASRFAELASIYGVATRDGLLLRQKPDNKSEQVYRLRLGQEVKLLEKVDGELVETGGVALEGAWYRALAADGTTGYVFSNQLTRWDAAEGPKPLIAIDKPEADATLSTLFSTVWRPDYFDTMVADGRVDLGTYTPRYGVFSYSVRKQIRVERPEFSKAYNYSSIARKDDGSYELRPSGATVAFPKGGGLVFTPPESDVPADALAKARAENGDDAVVSYAFVDHKSDVLGVIAAEERKRLARLSEFVAHGDRFESERAGVLLATRSARFTWVAYGALTPDIIPEGSGETGSIVMDLFLSPELQAAWQGAFTLRFESGQKPAVMFAYRFDGDRLVIARIAPELVFRAIVAAPDGLSPTAEFSVE